MGEGRRGLGRGLSALIDEAGPADAAAAAAVRDLPIDLIAPNPDQPRRTFAETELDELAASIRTKGVLQPILVRPRAGGTPGYMIVAGERRWRAAQRAGLHAVPAIVREYDDLQVMEIALIENLQRTDLSPIEEARAFAAMAARFSRSHDVMADMVGKSRSHVANTLRLLRLPQVVQDHVDAGRLSAGHARPLIDAEDAAGLAERIIAGGLNVRQAEALARSAAKAGAKLFRRPAPDADTRDLEASLSDVLGLAVQIRDRDGAGELRLRYASLEQLDDLCRRLMRPPG